MAIVALFSENIVGEKVYDRPSESNRGEKRHRVEYKLQIWVKVSFRLEIQGSINEHKNLFVCEQGYQQSIGKSP